MSLNPEVLVSITMRFPAVDPCVLAEHVSDVVSAAVTAGGIGTNINVMPFNPDTED